MLLRGPSEKVLSVDSQNERAENEIAVFSSCDAETRNAIRTSGAMKRAKLLRKSARI